MGRFNLIAAVSISLALLPTFYSCKGKTQKKPVVLAAPLAVHLGDTVTTLGKNIDCIFQDHTGRMWFASNGDGLYCFDGKVLKHITMKDGLISNFVLKIEEDVNGNLWCSTRDGYSSFNGSYFRDYTDSVIHAPFEKLIYKNGGLFFNHTDGICFYDGISFRNFTIHPKNYKPDMADMNRPYGIYATATDEHGNVWFGTQSEGVCLYDGNSCTYLTGNHLAGPAVRAILQDSKGNMWFGNNGGGLFSYNNGLLHNITEEKGLGNPDFLRGEFNNKSGTMARIFSLNEDSKGRILIGTVDAGLWVLQNHSLVNHNTANGLPGTGIWVIFKDRNGEIWLSVDGEKICKFSNDKFYEVKFG
ncbi:MAG: two-component regulator propeller domain-containing protein [Chitinophagales bacterium]